MSLLWDGGSAVEFVVPPFLRFAQVSCPCGSTKYSMGQACRQCRARLDSCCMERQTARKCARCHALFCADHLTHLNVWEMSSVFDGPLKLDGGAGLIAVGPHCEDCAGLIWDEQLERADQRARAILRTFIPQVGDEGAALLRHAEAFLATDRAGETAEIERQLRRSEKLPTTRAMYTEAYGAAAGKRGA